MNSETAISFTFTIRYREMRAFAEVSGDHNPIHLDERVARQRGFEGCVVYGGLLAAKISRLIGMELPTKNYLWTRLEIDFRKPLYIGQEAVLAAEIASASEAVRAIKLRFRITSGGRAVATGAAEAVLLGDG